MSTQKKSNVLAIIVMILLFGMISFVTNLASPMGDVLKNQFSVANWMGTLGVFANFIAYACMGIPAGNLLQKRGYKFTALAAVAVGFTGVGVQTIAGLLAGNVAFGVYLLGAFIAGFSMCMLNIVVNPMLNKLAGGGNRGNQLLQVGGSFNSFMGTAVIFLTGIFVPSIADAEIKQVFPLMFIALAIFAVAFVVILCTNIPETERSAEVKKSDNTKIGPMSFRHFVLGAVAIFIYVGVEVGIPNVLQKWLQNGGLNVETGAEGIAATVAATYWLLMFFGRLAGAALGAKVSAKAMLTSVSVLGLGLVLGAMVLNPENTV
ncbi:MAG: MFS transporter, partial [Alistipes sp.]|nr:MFS transporter [Alistipes sp.]